MLLSAVFPGQRQEAPTGKPTALGAGNFKPPWNLKLGIGNFIQIRVIASHCPATAFPPFKPIQSYSAG
jgi:hypothetical protein